MFFFIVIYVVIWLLTTTGWLLLTISLKCLTKFAQLLYCIHRMINIDWKCLWRDIGKIVKILIEIVNEIKYFYQIMCEFFNS